MNLLDRSLWGALLVACILLMRGAGRRRLPTGLFPLLWALTALFLLVPFRMHTGWALPSVAAPPTPPSIILPEAVVPLPQEPWQAPAQPVSGKPFPWALVYACGVSAAAFYFAFGHLRQLRRHRHASSLDVRFLSDRVGGWSPPPNTRLRCSSQADTPLTYGLCRPVILLPKDWTSWPAERLHFVLLHETAHIRNRDAALQYLVAAAVGLHWFNPAAWAMLFFSALDVELHCDRCVLRGLLASARPAYVGALLDLEQSRLQGTMLARHFSYRAMKGRVLAIMKQKKTTKWAVALSVVALLGTTLLFACSPAMPTEAATPAETASPSETVTRTIEETASSSPTVTALSPTPSPVPEKSTRLLHWGDDHLADVFAEATSLTLYDLHTGKSFLINTTLPQGHGHADWAPATREDNAVLLDAVPTLSFRPRPCLVILPDGRTTAAAYSTLPHSEPMALDNDFPGVACLHFAGSVNVATGEVNETMQAAVLAAYEKAP